MRPQPAVIKFGKNKQWLSKFSTSWFEYTAGWGQIIPCWKQEKIVPAKSLKLGNAQGVRRPGSQKKGYVAWRPKDFLALEDMA